jgi:hypothetical protein
VRGNPDTDAAVEGALQAARKRRQEPTPSGVAKVLREHRAGLLRVIQPIGAGLGRRLGCGTFGCVWEILHADLTPSRHVCKISMDPTEGPVTQAILDTGLDKQLDGLVRFLGVWRVPGAYGRSGTAWVIVRENIAPAQYLRWDAPVPYIGPGHPDRADFQIWRKEEDELVEALLSYNLAARDVIRLKSGGRQVAANQARLRAISMLYGTHQGYELAWAVESLQEAGITLADIHTGNLGHRIHDWPPEQYVGEPYGEVAGFPIRPLVIFDPGHSRVAEGRQPRIEELVRANPGRLVRRIRDLDDGWARR